MSAVLKGDAPADAPDFAVMSDADLPEVIAIERAIYSHPWTQGNFSDSLRAGYQCRTLRAAGELIGYFVLVVAAGEAHLLNLSVSARHHRRGHGATLLHEVMRLSRELASGHVFLEVRPSNEGAQALYARFGFRRIAQRRGYYPALAGREDALVYMREL